MLNLSLHTLTPVLEPLLWPMFNRRLKRRWTFDRLH